MINLLHEQIKLLLEYCKMNPMDNSILNKLDDRVIKYITTFSSILVSNQRPYLEFKYKKNTYIFRFKDTDTANYIMNIKCISYLSSIDANYNFDYDSVETGTIVCGHELKAIFCSSPINSSFHIEIFEAKSHMDLISIDDGYTLIHKNIQKFINTNIKFAEYNEWIVCETIPQELCELVNTNKVLLSLAS